MLKYFYNVFYVFCVMHCILYIIDPNIVNNMCIVFHRSDLGLCKHVFVIWESPDFRQVLRCVGSWLVAHLWGPVEIFVPVGGLVIHHAAYRCFPKDPSAITPHLCVCGMFICDIIEWATTILLLSHRPPSLSNLYQSIRNRKWPDKTEKWNGERNKRSTILSQGELLCLSGSLPIKRKWAEVIAMESTWVVP